MHCEGLHLAWCNPGSDLLLTAWYCLIEKVVCRCSWDYVLGVVPYVLFVYVLLSSLDLYLPGTGTMLALSFWKQIQ